MFQYFNKIEIMKKEGGYVFRSSSFDFLKKCKYADDDDIHFI